MNNERALTKNEKIRRLTANAKRFLEEIKALENKVKKLEKENKEIREKQRAWNKVANQVEARFGVALDKMLEGKKLIDNK
ncbi:unnamed protein product [marine sediment metagenome]|uniref:Uncharacterized protein n=1 Tax=marine sediment metagenome TaxID=412755 RepID=X0UB78_9ZZZZ